MNVERMNCPIPRCLPTLWDKSGKISVLRSAADGRKCRWVLNRKFPVLTSPERVLDLVGLRTVTLTSMPGNLPLAMGRLILLNRNLCTKSPLNHVTPDSAPPLGMHTLMLHNRSERDVRIRSFYRVMRHKVPEPIE